jgi:small conductance mechanosensitive channel
VISTIVWTKDDAVGALVMLAIAVVLSVVVRTTVSRLRKRMDAADGRARTSLRRAATLTHTLSNTLLVVIWSVTLMLFLDQFGVSLAPLIASAGIAGIAIGFGAQSLVRDGLSGFFILLENQFDLGDSVDVRTIGGNVAGRVEGFTMRITSVRQFDGTLNYVPNGNIQIVSNKSRGWGRAIVDVRITATEDPARVRGVLEELCGELHDDPELSPSTRSGPDVLGLETIAEDIFTFRVIADTPPRDRVAVERLLRERVAARLAERGISAKAGA